MSPTALLPSSRLTPSNITIAREKILPNPWNPNRMTGVMYAKALESIELYGFIDPLLVRQVSESIYQIIDGEHRFRAGSDLGMIEFPCVSLGEVSDTDAKKLTIVMNELHGQADPTRMGDLLNEILTLTSMDELLQALPYTEDILAGFLGVTDLTPLPGLGEPPDPQASGDFKEPWVERLYKLPKTAALVVDEAIEKAKDGDELENWQGLERVAADYLAS